MAPGRTHGPARRGCSLTRQRRIASPEILCAIAKLNASTREFTCLLRAHAKLLRGSAADLSKCGTKLSEAFAKAEARWSCPVGGAVTIANEQVEEATLAVLDDLHASTAAADELKCLLRKIKLSAKYAACQARELTLRLEGYDTPLENFVECRTALESRFADEDSSSDCTSGIDIVAVADDAGGAYGFLPGVSSGNLGGAIVPNGYLVGADLSNSHLRSIDLSGSDLTRANFENTYWNDADLSGAQLGDASLLNAEMEPVNMNGAVMDTTVLTGIRAISVAGCPSILPPEWTCLAQTLIGPTANLDRLDFRGVDFSGANLSEADLYRTDFTGAILVATNFSGAGLESATFENADGDSADFANANMRSIQADGASFVGANFTGASLYEARMGTADLTGADLTDAQLRRVTAAGLVGCPAVLPAAWRCEVNTIVGLEMRLPGGDLHGADLSGLDLSDSWLTDADLSDTNLTDSILSDAVLLRTDLTRADLTGADFLSADLSDTLGIDLAGCPTALPATYACVLDNLVGPSANLSGANLAGADLSGMSLFSVNFASANLLGVNLAGALLTGLGPDGFLNTVCPDGHVGDCCNHYVGDAPADCAE